MTDRLERPGDEQPEDRLTDRLDAVLHLLDRQVLDREGAMVSKVDDLELTEHPDGTLRVTGLLTGPAALVPRLGGDDDERTLRWWGRFNPSRADRTVPGRIDISAVHHLTSAVVLDVDRDDLVHLQGDAPEGTTLRRLNDLLGMHVIGPGEQRHDRVVDVRIVPDESVAGRGLRMTSVLVGRARPGTLMGYDRANVTRPWPIARLLGWVNRHTAQLDLDDVEAIDWNQRVVRARSAPKPLRELDTD